ncbi:sulfatase-like hydrolase/transferase [uncultured Bacteroides sp.]|uniref:sulfatase-like hydrolase/transferase n=1 Tax=uncultured Bacteroides sp. TaxID=162156 RepID=UPI002626B9BB|nr:sulfatase-like hydrolase/transferase [uncultured Bacteroides sp.]
MKIIYFPILVSFGAIGEDIYAGNINSEVLPNIVIIVVDDMGYSDFACYGNKSHKTPNIDRLAKEGIIFTDFHTNGVVSSPTRAALMTGRYQQYSGIEGVITAASHRKYGLSTDIPTIAKLLKQKNYETAIFGKWHLGYDKKYNPVNHGFDRFVGYVAGNVDYFSHIDQEGYEDWWENDIIKPEVGYTTDIITDHAVEYIKEKKDRPFFVYVPYEACHYPLQGPNDRAVRSISDGKLKVTGTGRADYEIIYKEMVESVDDNVGRIMKVIKDLKLDEETLIFFFSDNGGAKYASNFPWSGGKGSLLEGGHRVSSIARWCGHIRPGSVSDEILMTFDIMPTVCEATGIDMKGVEHDGYSILRMMTEGKAIPERTLFWRTRNGICARKYTWKLHVDRKYEHVRLYNLKYDIEEKTNVAGYNTEIVKMLLDEIKKWDANFRYIKQFS